MKLIQQLSDEEYFLFKKCFKNKKKKIKKRKRVYLLNINDVKIIPDFKSDVDGHVHLN